MTCIYYDRHVTSLKESQSDNGIPSLNASENRKSDWEKQLDEVYSKSLSSVEEIEEPIREPSELIIEEMKSKKPMKRTGPVKDEPVSMKKRKAQKPGKGTDKEICGVEAVNKLHEWKTTKMLEPDMNNPQKSDDAEHLYAKLLEAIGQKAKIPDSVVYNGLTGKSAQKSLWVLYIELIKDLASGHRGTRSVAFAGMLKRLEILEEYNFETRLLSAALKELLSRRIDSSHHHKQEVEEVKTGDMAKKLTKTITETEAQIKKLQTKLAKDQKDLAKIETKSPEEKDKETKYWAGEIEELEKLLWQMKGN